VHDGEARAGDEQRQLQVREVRQRQGQRRRRRLQLQRGGRALEVCGRQDRGNRRMGVEQGREGEDQAAQDAGDGFGEVVCRADVPAVE
jgi:hypothetical protein